MFREYELNNGKVYQLCKQKVLDSMKQYKIVDNSSSKPAINQSKSKNSLARKDQIKSPSGSTLSGEIVNID